MHSDRPCPGGPDPGPSPGWWRSLEKTLPRPPDSPPARRGRLRSVARGAQARRHPRAGPSPTPARDRWLRWSERRSPEHACGPFKLRKSAGQRAGESSTGAVERGALEQVCSGPDFVISFAFLICKMILITKALNSELLGKCVEYYQAYSNYATIMSYYFCFPGLLPPVSPSHTCSCHTR